MDIVARLRSAVAAIRNDADDAQTLADGALMAEAADALERRYIDGLRDAHAIVVDRCLARDGEASAAYDAGDDHAGSRMKMQGASLAVCANALLAAINAEEERFSLKAGSSDGSEQ